MAWTPPRTDWANGELVTAADLNAIGENLAALQSLTALENRPIAAGITTRWIESRSRVFVDVDSSAFNLTITTSGGDVLVTFSGSVDHDAAAKGYYDVEVDGTRIGGSSGIRQDKEIDQVVLMFTHLIQDLGAGAHTFKLQWKTNTGVLQMAPYSQFWVREI